MRILLSNDDGIDALGIGVLEQHLRALGDVIVVAPATEQSARSHAITMHEPLRVQPRGAGRFGVTGTPADCVYLGVHHLCGEKPDVVVSGINHGTNLGDDLHYSGTVAAAREGALAGLPALAVSMDVFERRGPDGGRADPAEHRFDTAAALAVRVVRAMMAGDRPARCLLNLNVPDVPPDVLPGMRQTRIGRRQYLPMVERKRDPRGRPYYWIGGDHAGYPDGPDTDGYWFSRGWATLSPVATNLTDASTLRQMSQWGLPD